MGTANPLPKHPSPHTQKGKINKEILQVPFLFTWDAVGKNKEGVRKPHCYNQYGLVLTASLKETRGSSLLCRNDTCP